MDPSVTDAAIMEAIRAGGRAQERGITQLYEQHFSLISEGRRRYRLLSDEDLLSAYNSSIISLRRQILQNTFRGDSSLKTYLYRIFQNKCIDILRKNSTNKENPVAEVPEEASAQPGIIQRLIARERFEWLNGLLDQLGDPCRQILLDAEYWGYSPAEIAERIGFSNARSVSSKKYTCLQQLRKLVQGQYQGLS